MKFYTPGNYPNQLYGWQVDDDGTWSLYAQNGTKAITVSPTGGVSFLNVPTSDPHVVGRIYTTAGAVKISTG